ncbi:hypothetical protein [Mesorhizobium sp. M0195]|uniref:hypothetical protein n=1 Tax=Mesorhizobium sp. M0195 TaxID=2956910 RepID=UPI00333D3079
MLDHHRPSPQTRPVLPEAGGDIHPRCREMAEAMRDLHAAGGGVRFADLIQADFTSAEIVEFKDHAARLARELSMRQVSARPDLMADIIDKARQAMSNRLPLPRDTRETQALIVSWGRYCAARDALVRDPWSGQRERCLALLTRYLNQLPIWQANRETVIRAVDQTLAKVAQ